MDFILHPFTPDTLDLALDVYRQCEDFLALGPQPKASMEMVRADWQLAQDMGSQFCGIYIEGDKLVGIADYLLSGYEGNPQTAYLSLLMIAYPYRNLGLGAQVATWIEAQARQLPGVTAIEAGVQVNNPGAIRFWQRQGYAIVSGPHEMPDQTTAFHLRKPLEG
jgi:ribosomal protein S18 acetylase RimI-like enzyme